MENTLQGQNLGKLLFVDDQTVLVNSKDKLQGTVMWQKQIL